MPVINANSVDPDQTPRSAVSDLGLHCLPMSHFWDARHKWVNTSKLCLHNPFMPSKLFYHNYLDGSISNRRLVTLDFLLLPYFIKQVLYLMQTVASDLGLHCLPMSFL